MRFRWVLSGAHLNAEQRTGYLATFARSPALPSEPAARCLPFGGPGGPPADGAGTGRWPAAGPPGGAMGCRRGWAWPRGNGAAAPATRLGLLGAGGPPGPAGPPKPLRLVGSARQSGLKEQQVR